MNNHTMNAPAEIFIIIALLYFVICLVLTEASRRLEGIINRYRARVR